MEREKRNMTLLIPSFLWLLIPLLLLFLKGSKRVVFKVHIVILMLLVIALSRPVQEEALQEANIQAKDLIIALDVSYSMQAKDLSPTRYAFAKETIKSLLKQNPTDNIMLIAFTTNPLLLSPPSTDHALIGIALDTLNPEFILTKGTSLKRLFTKLSSLNAGHKNLILITDGGEESDVATLANLLNKADISLMTLALGSRQGTTITMKKGALLKDKEGNLVVSRINPLLAELSTAVNGTYFTASSSPQKTASLLSAALRNQAEQIQNVQKMQRYYLELYQIPLLLAALLFLLVHTRGVKYLILLLTLFGVQVQASVFDTYYLHQAYGAYEKHDFNASKKYVQKIDVLSLQSQMTLANTYYKNHAFKKAIQTYTSIRSTSVPIKQQLYYNIATAYAQLASYSKAKVYYTKALQLGVDADAQHNLKIVTFLADKKAASLGIAHPKSQSSQASKNGSQEENKENHREENQPSSGAGAGGESKSKENKEKNKLLHDDQAQKQPLGSKVYELINKGYIRETQPW